MGQGRETYEGKKNTAFFVFVLILASLFPAVIYAQSNAVTISAPTGSPQTSAFSMRTHPVTGQAAVPHRGLDYGVACGTNLQARGGTLACSTMNGYGGVGQVSHACGVVERYAHLQACNTSSGMTTGGGRGMQGAGTSTGCHLHYEILINGTAVNPASAYGKNLCDEATRRELIEEAQRILQGRAGGGGGASSSGSGTPAPPAQTTGDTPRSVTYVESGAIDPRTNLPNLGGGYYIVETYDGRTQVQYDVGAEESTRTILPPTDTNVVATGGTGPGETTGCATDTWTAMVNQAVLQTRREDMMNKRFIAKADSVLAYSCFFDPIDKARERAGIFSESQEWENRDVTILEENVRINVSLGQYSLDGALTNAALMPYERYMNSFFNHDFLGGLGGEVHGSGAHEHDSPQAYAACNAMAQIWSQAKCLNMNDSPMFPKFSELTDNNNDPRKYPEQYKCFDTGITQGMIDIAQNKNVQFSKMQTHIDIIAPQNANACGEAIMTGVTVHRQEGASQISREITYPDGLCIAPGCSYQNGGGSSQGTCQVKGP